MSPSTRLVLDAIREWFARLATACCGSALLAIAPSEVSAMVGFIGLGLAAAWFGVWWTATH